MGVGSLVAEGLLFLLVVAVEVSSESAELTDVCLRCICEQEGCESNVDTCSADGKCGPYGITQEYWEQGGTPGNGDYQQCAGSMECSETAVRNYIAKYGEQCTQQDLADPCTGYAMLHSAGPSGCVPPCACSPATMYARRVQTCVNGTEECGCLACVLEALKEDSTLDVLDLVSEPNYNIYKNKLPSKFRGTDRRTCIKERRCLIAILKLIVKYKGCVVFELTLKITCKIYYVRRTRRVSWRGTNCLKCLRKARNGDSMIGENRCDKNIPKSCGPYLITKKFVEDCLKKWPETDIPKPKLGKWVDCAEQRECAEKCIGYYADKYAEWAFGCRAISCEQLVKLVVIGGPHAKNGWPKKKGPDPSKKIWELMKDCCDRLGCNK